MPILLALVFTGAMCSSTSDTNTNSATVNSPANLNEAIGNELCKDTATSKSLSYDDAKEIAESSDCVSEGNLKTTHMCNENTGTWWIDLDIKKEGCSPACVINVNDKTAEINWMCTGLISE